MLLCFSNLDNWFHLDILIWSFNCFPRCHNRFSANWNSLISIKERMRMSCKSVVNYYCLCESRIGSKNFKSELCVCKLCLWSTMACICNKHLFAILVMKQLVCQVSWLSSCILCLPFSYFYFMSCRSLPEEMRNPATFKCESSLSNTAFLEKF